MPDTIKFKGKNIAIKKKLTFGEVIDFQKTLSNVLVLGEKIKSATDQDIEEIAKEGIENNATQMGIIANVIKSSIGWNDKDLKKITFLDAIALFNTIYEDSTVIKKKSDQPYG